MRLVTQGHSWSGHERHVFYLNERTGKFANASFVSGLDYPDDGRALALTDWDQDGDLDVWFRNRTAPRLRLMRNEHGQKRPAVALLLEGVTSNRDAIGAVAEIITAKGKPLVRSLRAGDLFMSQSSRWLHFGLGGETEILEVRVLWPGGEWERFGGVAAGNRYRLRQGTGQAEDVPGRDIETPLQREAGALAGGPDRTQARVILPARVPLFPSFSYRDQALQPKTLEPSSKGRLLLFWSSACLRCRQELTELARSSADLSSAGLEVLGLSVDAVEQAGDAYDFMDAVQWPFPWGFIEAPVVARLEHLQNALFDRAIPFSVPLGLLIDENQNVLALYRGTVEAGVLLEDAKALLTASDETLHHLAPPFAGRWFTNPVPRAFVAENLARRFEERFPDEALPYLHLAYEQSRGDRKEKLQLELGTKHQRLAQEHAEANRPEAAAAVFEKALLYIPDSAALHHNYGILLARYGQLQRARQLLQKARHLDPQAEATQEALRMVEEAISGK